jgi:uncharacterized membrane protein YbhN (UPF0104 family)
MTGVESLDARSLILGAGIAGPVTVACAWRWHLVAGVLGVAIRVPTAVASYYRSQFLNTVLPGGVLGDVHRGVLHGREVADTGRALRAVAWERLAGQAVLVAFAMVVLLLLPSPVSPAMPMGVALLVAGSLLCTSVALRQWRVPTCCAGRVLRVVLNDSRLCLTARGSWVGVVLASALAVGGHVVTYLVAARAVGVTAPLATLLPLSVLVLVAAGLPLNLAGWGPREGMAAFTFAAAGLGADQGVATAVAYGAMVFVANLPGAIVLLTTSKGSRAGRLLERLSSARWRPAALGGPGA